MRLCSGFSVGVRCSDRERQQRAEARRDPRAAARGWISGDGVLPSCALGRGRPRAGPWHRSVSVVAPPAHAFCDATAAAGGSRCLCACRTARGAARSSSLCIVHAGAIPYEHSKPFWHVTDSFGDLLTGLGTYCTYAAVWRIRITMSAEGDSPRSPYPRNVTCRPFFDQRIFQQVLEQFRGACTILHFFCLS